MITLNMFKVKMGLYCPRKVNAQTEGVVQIAQICSSEQISSQTIFMHNFSEQDNIIT